MTVRIRDEIARLAAERRLPAVYEQRRLVLSGGLLSYGPDLTENYRHGADYVDRVLRERRSRTFRWCREAVSRWSST
jgi:putative tryptophan/tyrosine transport system substrate-binding protein